MKQTINVPDGFKISKMEFVPIKSHRVKNKWWKELKWAIQEWLDTRALERAVKRGGEFYELHPCTHEAKKWMEEVHKTKGERPSNKLNS